METKKRKYQSKFALTYTRCLNCNFVYETTVGDFDLEIEVVTLAEELHADNSKKCKNSKLIIYPTKYYVEIK